MSTCYSPPHAIDRAKRLDDFREKTARLRSLLQQESVDCIVLSYSHNFAWLTGGARNFVNMAMSAGVASLAITATKVMLVTNSIEGHRLMHEEMDGLQCEIMMYEDPWYDQGKHAEVAKRELNVKCVVSDVANAQIEAALIKLRSELTPYEVEMYRALGLECGQVIEDVARQVKRGDSEWKLAGRISDQLWQRGITPVVILVAADERIDNIRHPLPTTKWVHNKAMLVLGGRRAGLIVSVTRLVYLVNHEGESIPDDLVERHNAVTYVDAVAMHYTRPGVKANELFGHLVHAYEKHGYPTEWQLHHQGGLTGYNSREWIASPTQIAASHAYSWNPSVTGTKSEDTVLLVASEGSIKREIISMTSTWPTITHQVEGESIERPAILRLVVQ